MNAPQERMTVVAVVMMAMFAMDAIDRLVVLGGSTVGAVYGDVGSADEGRRSDGTDDGQSERLPESV